MKTKFLLPVLAMIFATGMSFTTLQASEDAETGYIERSPGQWEQVNVDCQGTDKCLVKFRGETEIYQVFEGMNTSQPIKGSGVVKVLTH